MESDRSGRSEVWRLDLLDEYELEVDGGPQKGIAGQPVIVRFDGPVEGTEWRLLEPDRTRQDGLVFEPEAGTGEGTRSYRWLPDADLPEGVLQLIVALQDGSNAATPLVIDRTPPVITITRLSDKQPLDLIEDISPLDQFVVNLENDPTARMTVVDGAEQIAAGHIFDATGTGAADITLVAEDAAGNRTSLRADISVGQGDEPRVSDDTESSSDESVQLQNDDVPDRDTDDADSDPVMTASLLLLLLLIISGGIMVVVVSRQRRK